MEEILNWDRAATLFINGSHSLFWDQTVYVATSTIVWVPLGLVIFWLIWKHTTPSRFFTIVVLFALAIFISETLSSTVFKPIFQRWRPTQDPLYMYAVDTVHNYRGGRFGFFSAHASNTFSVATFLCFLFRRKWLNVLVVSWALLNCYTRLYLGVHYVGDILVGTFFGLVIGSLLYRVYLWRCCKGEKTQEPLLDEQSAQILVCGILFNYVMLFVIALAFWV